MQSDFLEYVRVIHIPPSCMLSQGHLADKSFLSLSVMFLKVMLARLQVALNLDLAGVESFVRERLGKEVKIWLNGWLSLLCYLRL